MQIWLFEVLKGVGRFFLNPISYYLLFLAGILGVMRVKRERKNFHIRAFDAYFELRQLIPPGLIAGLLLSLIIIAAGIPVPFAALVMITLTTILLSFTTIIRLLSPAYTVGAAFFVLAFFGQNNWNPPVFTSAFHALHGKLYPSIAVLLALFLITEGYLIMKNGSYGTSPKLIRSKRGQSVGVHEVKRVWLLPLFLLVPGNAIDLPFAWWPVFHIGAENYHLFLFPLAVGFQQQIQSMLPIEAIRQLGKRVVWLGVITLVLSAAGYLVPVASIFVVAFAVIGREVLSIQQRVRDESHPFYFSKKNSGLMILGIIPNSPADKMSLQVGELISKVNGIQVKDENVFYEALQKNRAHCKLEVIDTNGENRFVQRALYEGDHHELGILFVQEERKDGTKIG